MLWGYTAVSKLRLQTEVAKLLREYCDKGDPKVIASTVIIRFTSLTESTDFLAIPASVFWLCFCWRIALRIKQLVLFGVFFGDRINGSV